MHGGPSHGGCRGVLRKACAGKVLRNACGGDVSRWDGADGDGGVAWHEYEPQAMPGRCDHLHISGPYDGSTCGGSYSTMQNPFEQPSNCRVTLVNNAQLSEQPSNCGNSYQQCTTFLSNQATKATLINNAIFRATEQLPSNSCQQCNCALSPGD